ncbi:MAG: hypothetical protein EXS08_07900 [Planctomycetes bacterium]|nr:hypothetical protein [Planctomycetota bacterium]
MRALAAALLACWCASARTAQEPPPAPEGDQQQKEKEKQQEVPPPQPAPEVQDPKPEPVSELVPSSTIGDAPAAPVAAPAPAHPAVVWPLSSPEVAQHLRGIAAAHPGVAALEVVGRASNGEEILALRLGARDNAGPRPTLLLLDYQGRASCGPEVALSVAWELAGSFERDERVRALLTHAELVIAPALDPSARAPEPVAAPVRFERNFPSGWQPDTIRPGSGRVSLSLPEARAAVSYLANLKGCAVLLGFSAPGPRGVPYAGAELPALDREVFAKLGAALELEGATAMVPWFELGSPGGSLFDFAYQARGIFPLAFPLPTEEELGAGGLDAYALQVGARVLQCLSLLPRVEVVQEGLERLFSDTWQLDLRIQNVGILPTVSALARHRGVLSDVVLQLEGAKLLATADKPANGAPYTNASLNVRAPLSAGMLSGGEGRWLRLLLEGASGAEVRVRAGSAWAGSDVLQLTLP